MQNAPINLIIEYSFRKHIESIMKFTLKILKNVFHFKKIKNVNDI